MRLLGKGRIFIKNNNLMEPSIDEELSDMRQQVRQKIPIRFRNFGLQNSALFDLKKRESLEKIPKKKDFMLEVSI